MDAYTPNWTKAEFERTCKKAFFIDMKPRVHLDTSRSDSRNEKDIVRWAKENGWKAEVLNSGDTIRITP